MQNEENILTEIRNLQAKLVELESLLKKSSRDETALQIVGSESKISGMSKKCINKSSSTDLLSFLKDGINREGARPEQASHVVPQESDTAETSTLRQIAHPQRSIPDEGIPMACTRVVMHQIVMPSEVHSG
jgi:hypothetical protein